MEETEDTDRAKVWRLIKGAHSALLVTIDEDGSLDSRPMGCVQSEFNGTLSFLTFRHSLKLKEIEENERVLVSYANSSKYEYVSASGRAKLVDDRKKIKKFWNEGLRVWFPKGPEDPELALLDIDVETVRYWTNAASAATYAWAYVKARLTGESPSFDEIGDTGFIRIKEPSPARKPH